MIKSVWPSRRHSLSRSQAHLKQSQQHGGNIRPPCASLMSWPHPHASRPQAAETQRVSCISRRKGWICRSVLVSWLPVWRIREGQTRHVLNVWAGISKAVRCTVSFNAGNPKRLRSLCRRTASWATCQNTRRSKCGGIISLAFIRFLMVSAPNASGTFVRRSLILQLRTWSQRARRFHQFVA